MFDIGFWELMVIAVMGLVILGPDRLPTAIRSVRQWVRNIQRFSHNVQTELKEELRIHELHNNLKEAEKQGFENLTADVKESVESLKKAADEATRPYADAVNDESKKNNDG
ncbi:Sec-independent protein translocase protein TatB [Thalassotalea mangrovi]|uniref:Sec-independent protein translocase protein TatB n=1 Tax=Thalassotalea mangrovi TaxID=2572245 RepID=A0A4U1B6U6_9GAMM|nr:Sec-independent protein translocase protein TatB [Thalassotalea mangrovi]TKB46287.1 Sec-independent protein translocase subunit TatB [Thalassotalea mangrovi]